MISDTVIAPDRRKFLKLGRRDIKSMPEVAGILARLEAEKKRKTCWGIHTDTSLNNCLHKKGKE